jgi:hypothetical protein
MENSELRAVQADLVDLLCYVSDMELALASAETAAASAGDINVEIVAQDF